MVLAPFSELNGRRPIFLITGFLFFVFVICSAVTRSFAGMLIARFLTGCAGSTFSTMVGGVVSDIYIASDRNAPMTLFTAGALFGTGIGPLVSGFVAQHISWRWIFYILSIIIFVLAVALLLVFKETRGPVLLSRKAHKLNQWYEAREAAGYFHFVADLNDGEKETTRRIRWKVKADEERASLWQMIRISLVRPFYMLVTEPVVVSTMQHTLAHTCSQFLSSSSLCGSLLHGLCFIRCLALFLICSRLSTASIPSNLERCIRPSPWLQLFQPSSV